MILWNHCHGYWENGDQKTVMENIQLLKILDMAKNSNFLM